MGRNINKKEASFMKRDGFRPIKVPHASAGADEVVGSGAGWGGGLKWPFLVDALKLHQLAEYEVQNIFRSARARLGLAADGSGAKN